MSFLYPSFLWALPLVAIPIIIHLINRRRFHRVDFAAMDFLRLAIKKTRKRLLLEDILLLLLRTLAVAAFILGLARPTQEANLVNESRPSKGIVFVIDNSLSMAHREQAQSALERAIQDTRRQLEQLEASFGDQAGLIIAGNSPRRIAIGDPSLVANALIEGTEQEFGNCQLVEALNSAFASTQKLQAEGCQEIDLLVYSDLQAREWADPSALPQLEILFAKFSNSGVKLNIKNIGGTTRDNLAITDFKINPKDLRPGNFGEVTANIRSYQQSDQDCTIQLKLDGNPIVEENIRVPANGEVIWSHTISPAFIGSRALEISIDNDALIYDNSASLVLNVQATPQVLLIGNQDAPGFSTRNGDTSASLLHFLDLGPDAPLLITEGNTRDLDQTGLADIDLLILADPPILDPSHIQSIQTFVASGGGLLLCLGPDCSASNMHQLLIKLQAGEVQIGEIQSISSRTRINDSEWPPLALFKDPRWQALLTEVPVLQWRKFTVPTNFEFNTPLSLLADADSGLNDAALSNWNYFQGKCAITNIAPATGLNRFREIPGGTLPFLFDLCLFLATKQSLNTDLHVGDELSVLLERPSNELILFTPDLQQLRPTSTPVELESGLYRQLLVDLCRNPGIWRAQIKDFSEEGNERSFEKLFAVNTPPNESDLAPIDIQLQEQLLGDSVVGLNINPEPEIQTRNNNFAARLFQLTLALLILESLIAAAIDRRRG